MKRILVFCLAALCAFPLSAGDGNTWWLRDADGNYLAEVGDISFLIASDTDASFTIVCTDGTLIPGITDVYPIYTVNPGVGSVPASGTRPVITVCADRTLTISGCAPGTPVAVVDASGRRVLGAVLPGGTSEINVSTLPSGMYILRAGATAVKFIKK